MKPFTAFALCALVVACRGEQAATATDAAAQFYTMREALGGTGAPSATELTALRPFITDSLARALTIADSLRNADMKQAPDEKPRFAEGDLFSSVFEAPTSCRAMPASASGDTELVTLECTDTRAKPAINWTDTAMVVRSDGRWRVHDIRYGGTWDFANKGSLLQNLQHAASEHAPARPLKTAKHQPQGHREHRGARRQLRINPQFDFGYGTTRRARASVPPMPLWLTCSCS